MQLSPSVCHSIQTAQLVLVYILVFTGVFLVSACPQVFQEMWRSSGKTARQIIQEKDLGLVSDTAQLHSICQKVVDLHPDEVRARMQILTCNPFFLFLFCIFEMFAVSLCRLTPSEMETRKFWTSWWGWFRKRPKAELTQFWWGQFYKRRPHEG